MGLHVPKLATEFDLQVLRTNHVAMIRANCIQGSIAIVFSF